MRTAIVLQDKTPISASPGANTAISRGRMKAFFCYAPSDNYLGLLRPQANLCKEYIMYFNVSW
jgi:hypothetical protein